MFTPTFETSSVELQISHRKTMPLTLGFVTQKISHEEHESQRTFEGWHFPEVFLGFQSHRSYKIHQSKNVDIYDNFKTCIRSARRWYDVGDCT